MTDEKAILSIDFLAGFTIFILAFIWVVSMIPGLMIGLQSYTIDYDAVAYRTGVMLVEDPGWPYSPPWESYNDLQKNNVTRFGLAISKDTPNILSEDKVNRFFCSTAFIYPDDYRTRVIFGDYPYGFRISLSDVGVQDKSTGDVLPDGYGYIRRLVKIKGSSNATLNNASYTANPSWIKNDNVTTHVFSILIDNPRLLGDVPDPAYQIDPSREQIMINITDLKSTIREFPLAVPPITRATSSVTLRNIKVYKKDGGVYSNVPLPASDFPYIDGSSKRVQAMPAPVTDNITLRFSPQFFERMKPQNSQIYIALGFTLNNPSTFLNNTQARPDFDTLDGKLTFENPNTTPFHYDYNVTNVTQPRLRDAVVEVAVWSGSPTGPVAPNTTPSNGSHTIYATAGNFGTISPIGSVTVIDGADQLFLVTPYANYHIADVVINGTSNGPITGYTFTNVREDHTIAATFALNAATGIFADDFDAVTAPSGWTTTANVTRSTSAPHSGTASIQLTGFSSMQRTIATTGNSSINISFEMGSQTTGAGDYVNAEWSSDGGTTWNLLKQINEGDIDENNLLHSFSYNLPASADNNANVVLRFHLEGSTSSDYGYIDNVVVGGIPL